MARSVTNKRKAINTIAAWSIGLLIFFPILWTILTSFKTEAQAISNPPVKTYKRYPLVDAVYQDAPGCGCVVSHLLAVYKNGFAR